MEIRLPSRRSSLCRKLGKFVHRVRVETDSHICTVRRARSHFLPFGSDQRMLWTILDGAHCIRCVPEQVQNHLLKLHTIGDDKRRSLSKVEFATTPDAAEVHFNESAITLLCRVVQVDSSGRVSFLSTGRTIA